MPAVPSGAGTATRELTPELVDRLVYYAARAPSPHNAQGWRIVVDDARFRVVRDDGRQVLRELDPHAHEGDFACGALTANLVVAAEAHGFTADVRWLPEHGVAAEVTLVPGRDPPDHARLDAVRRRATNRSRYRAEPVSQGVLAEAQELAIRAGLELSALTAPETISEVADIAARAGRLKISHRPTQRELHELMRFTPGTASAKRDGLDLELFFVPSVARRLARALLHPVVLSALEPFRVPAALARSAEGAAIRSASAVCLLHAHQLEADTFLEGGHCFEEIALLLTSADLALALHSAPIEIGLAEPGSRDRSLPSSWHGEIDALRARLLTAFGCAPGTVPLTLFRVGVPSRLPERRSLRRHPVAVEPEQPYYAELTRRNAPAVSADQQQALRRLRVLFAGCGSIGGAPVEPLVRMGLEQLVLAEPGEFETNNLNRQAAQLADVGRNKAAVLADRALAINPHAKPLVETSGVTADNVDWLVGTTDVIVDGVDVTEESGIVAKRLLHEEAWRQRRPVISGLDLGGTQLVYLFDYRKGRVRPLGGRLDRAPSRISSLDFLSHMIGALDVPRELLTYTEDVIRGRQGSAPQLAPTAAQFGVLAAWAVLELAVGRTLRRRVRVAIPGLLLTRRRRLANEAARVVQLVRLKYLLYRTRDQARD